MDADAVRRKVLTRDELEAIGIGARALDRGIAAGRWRRVHSGHYVRAADWQTAYSEERHLMRVLAVAARMRWSNAAFAFVSAAVLWGLPLYRLDPARVHLCGVDTSGLVSGTAGVARHQIAVPDSDRTVRAGLPCTTLERTVFDVIRLASEETGIACIDAALRLVAWDDLTRTYDEHAAEEWRAGLLARIDAAPGARGVRRARRLALIADGRAQLPGEAVSHLYLLRLGFTVTLQVVVVGPNGELYRVDFDLERAWGEFDGTGKYSDPELMKGVGFEVLAQEKAREDWIRGSTAKPFARWGSAHITDVATLERRLAAFHIFPRG